MHPVKVLHIISVLDPRYGGPVTALIGLCNAQVRCGLDVTVVGNGNNAGAIPVVERLVAHKVETQLLEPPLRFLRAPAPVLDRLEELVVHADIVHIHGVWEEVQHHGSRLARRHNKPVVLRPCGMLDPWSLAQSRWKKQIYMALRQRQDLESAVALHFTSEAERDLTRDLKLSPPSLVEPNGVDLAEFECLPAPGSFRARHSIVEGRPLVLFLSRIHPKKGLDLLIPAFARMEENDALLVIAGPDDEGYRAQVEAMVSSHHLEHRVIFTGMLTGSDRVAALADADLFVLPSYQENFGIAVVEALAAGTPVVISDQVNIHEQITEAGVGAVVPLDVDTLALQLGHWLQDSTLRLSAAERARDFVRTHYDWNAIARHWMNHYATILHGRKSA